MPERNDWDAFDRDLKERGLPVTTQIFRAIRDEPGISLVIRVAYGRVWITCTAYVLDLVRDLFPHDQPVDVYEDVIELGDEISLVYRSEAAAWELVRQGVNP